MKTFTTHWNFLVVLGFILVGLTGCAGLNSIPQSLGINSASRVPPPGTGSFAVPNSYTNGIPGGSSSAPAAGTPTSQINPVTQPTNQVLSSINRLQTRIQDSASQVRNTVNRVTEDLNSRVETASASVNRIGEGVVQASAIISESVQEATEPDLPPITTVIQDPNASWRSPRSAR